MVVANFGAIVKRVLPGIVRCSLIPVDSVLPSMVVVSSEVMAALLFLATEPEVITSERLVRILLEMKTPQAFSG